MPLFIVTSLSIPYLYKEEPNSYVSYLYRVQQKTQFNIIWIHVFHYTYSSYTSVYSISWNQVSLLLWSVLLNPSHSWQSHSVKKCWKPRCIRSQASPQQHSCIAGRHIWITSNAKTWHALWVSIKQTLLGNLMREKWGRRCKAAIAVQ